MRMTKLLAIGMIALGTIGQTGWGQEGETPNERQLETASLIDLNFAGGTLGQLVDVLKQKRPRANIMLVGEAVALKVPPFEVFGVTPAGAILVAKNIADAGRDIHIDTVKARDGSAPTTLVSVKRVSADDFRPSSWRIPSDAPTKAWNLKGWTMDNKTAIQNTLAAIQVGMESYDRPAVLQYHEPSGVFLARGDSQQIVFIDNIIRAAAERSGHEANADDLAAQIRDADDRLAAMQGELKVQQARHEVVIAMIKETEEQEGSRLSLAQARVSLAEFEANYAELMTKIKRTMEHREALKAKLDAMNASSSAP